jgi:hypothetical protein
MMSSSLINPPRLQPHLDNNIKKLVGVVWSSMTSSGCGDLLIVKKLHRWFILLLFLWRMWPFGPFGDFPSATNNIRSALGGVAAATRRRPSLEVDDEGHLKDFDVFFVFVLFIVSFNAKVLFTINK